MQTRVLHIFTVIVSLLFFSKTATAQVADVEFVNSSQIMAEGDFLMYMGKYSKAASLYRKVGRNDSNYIYVQMELCKALLNDKEDSLCLLTARNALRYESPIKADFYNVCGVVYKEMKKYDQALQVLDSGIAQYPYMFLMQYNKGLVYYNMKKYPEAQQCFQNAVKLNPYHASSHFMLGKSCAEQGRFVAALLAFEYYLMVDPSSDRSVKVVTTMEDIYNGNYDVDPDVQIDASEAGDDCFAEILDMINSKAPAQASYKNKTGMKFNVVKYRQALFEKLKYQEGTKNWWMEYYVPFYVEIQKNDYFVPYAYYTMASIDNKSVQKGIKKNKKKILAFAEWGGKYIKKHLDHPAKTHLKDQENVDYIFSDNRVIGGVGHSDEKDNPIGEWIYFYSRSGHIRARGNFNKEGKRDGVWTWYYDDGTLKEKITYVNGQRQGEDFMYYKSGVLKSKSNYDKDKLSGPYEQYAVHGGIEEKGAFLDDKPDGVVKLFYPNGTLKTEITYKNGKFEGLAKVYSIDGKIRREINFVNGKRQGISKDYYSDGKIQAEGENKLDEPIGNWKYYYEDGKIMREGAFKDKGLKDGLWKEYYRNGKVMVEAVYKMGKNNGDYREYSKDGKVTLHRIYKEDKLQKETFFDYNGKQLATYNTSKGCNVVEYHPNGEKLAEGEYADGLKVGEWKVYSANGGWMSSKENYFKGKLEGTRKEYYPNGKLKSELDFKNDLRYGLLKSYYQNGVIKTQGWYINDEREGDWYEYTERGNVENHYYYVNDALHGYQEYFDKKARKAEEAFYEEGSLWVRTRYDSTGREIYKYKSENGSGVYAFTHPNNKVWVETNYRNGTIEGALKRYSYNGDVRLEANYINGNLMGIRKEYYNLSGKKFVETSFEYNEKHGPSTAWYENGNLRWEEHYYYGELNGIQRYYYENGKLQKEANYVYGTLDGEMKFYTDDGKYIYSRHYDNGTLLGYSESDKEGKPAAMKTLEHASGKMTVHYADGSVYTEGEYVNGKIHGHWLTYHPNGKVADDENFYYGDFEGEQKYFYANGQLKESYNYFSDELDGKAEYFNEDGTPLKVEYYVQGVAFGTWVYYEKGKPTLTIKVYDDRVLSETKN
ncbi:MAG: hypothetical protein Fur0041_16770 [Bacteroidia bacterium]